MSSALNTRTQKVLARNVEIADNLFTRMKGLMGRPVLQEGQGMLIKRSGNSIHTFFMKFSIDLLFINKSGEVKWLRENVTPWKMIIAPLVFQTDCLELPGGTIKKTQTLIGDVIRVES